MTETLLFFGFRGGLLRWPTRDTLQTKKKPPKQKRKHANKTETTQIKKKPRKQKRKRKQKNRNHANKQKPRTQNRNHANKTETTHTKQKPRKQNRNHAHKVETTQTKKKLVPRALADFLCCFADQSNRGWGECFPPSVVWSTVRGVFDEEFRRCSAHAVGQN